MGGGTVLRAYNQMMELEYVIKERKIQLTVGEALRLIERLERKFDVRG